MHGVMRPLAFVLAAGAVMSVTPAQEPQYSQRNAGAARSERADDGPVRRQERQWVDAGQADDRGGRRPGRRAAGRGAALRRPRQGPLPDHHVQPAGAALFRPGAELRLRLQPRRARSPRSARRSGSIPNCAMCFWGEAFAHGPNINAPMDPAANARAVGLATLRQWLARKATPAEQALIDGDGRSAIRPTRRPTAPRSTRLMPTPCWPPPRRIPANDDIAAARRRSGDGHQPVELLDRRQAAAAAARRGDPAGRDGATAATPTIRRPRTSTSI